MRIYKVFCFAYHFLRFATTMSYADTVTFNCLRKRGASFVMIDMLGYTAYKKNSQFTEIRNCKIAGVMQDRLYFYQNESPASSACHLKDSQDAKNWDNALSCILAFIKRSALTC